MVHRGVVITAGFNRSKSAIAIAELLKQEGVKVKGFVVVSPYSLSRLQSYVSRRGFSFIKEAVPRLIGITKDHGRNRLEYLAAFFEEKNIWDCTIKEWAKSNSADFISVSSINEIKVQNYLKERSPQWLIYSGGGIIRNSVIEIMEGRILNAHQGPLPEVRGMNAAEWSILLGQKQEVTIHLIDHGIDTGKIITSFPFTVTGEDTIRSIRDKAMVKGIEGIVEVAGQMDVDAHKLKNNGSDYRQCYILSPAMKYLLNKKLRALHSVS